VRCAVRLSSKGAESTVRMALYVLKEAEGVFLVFLLTP
jgi:hypothetical protein